MLTSYFQKMKKNENLDKKKDMSIQPVYTNGTGYRKMCHADKEKKNNRRNRTVKWKKH